MKKLHTRFSLVLGSVLLVATLLPVLVLFLLSKSGLVEATYVTDVRKPGEQANLLRAILADKTPALPDLPRSPLAEENKKYSLPGLVIIGPEEGETRFPLVIDPATGHITGVESDFMERIVLTSRVFKFRVDLPAWIAIGTFPLFGLLLGLALSLVMSRSITRPISQLADAAQAIGRRDLSYRVATRGSQEIQDLALSFNRMAEQLEHTETNRRNLMADVAHELRTPLAVLDGNLRAMLDGVHALNEEEIALLYEQTHHLNRLVNDLRDLSLAEADQLSLERQEVDLNHLVRETVAHFDPLAREQKIQLAYEIDEPLHHPCLDENRIRQVLHNLLSNAFRYTPAGGKVLISAGRSLSKPDVKISVTDSGAGIPQDDLPYIFDRFYRTKRADDNDRSGTGLGLAIVKAFVEAQDGQVHVESAGWNQGSTFTIHFPLNGSTR